jgi:hypothetical protein
MNLSTRAHSEYLMLNNDIGVAAVEPSSCFGWSSPFAANVNISSNDHNNTSVEEIDKFLATSMAELNFQERQDYQEDLHGVSSSNPEDPDQIERWLDELETHLNAIKRGSNYQAAEVLDASYVTNRDFRIMFVRGNRYKTKEAANQIISFFDMKRRLFGRDKLVKEITLNDLDDDDKESLKSGSFQVLPHEDRAGRILLLGLPGLSRNQKLENDLRARFYFFMTVLKSERAQLKGVVAVSYTAGQFKDRTQGADFIDQTKLSLALPVHWAGVHLCSDDHLQYLLVSACLKMIPSQLRARFKVHIGSYMECQYCVKPYGIPPESLPSPSSSVYSELGHHLRWYKECQSREASASDGTTYDLPTNLHIELLYNDVLFGGKKNSNGGNKSLRSLVKSNSNEYDTGTKTEKRALIDHVVREIRKTGGRFLKQAEEDIEKWEEVSLEEACGKIAQAFRNNRRPRASQVQEGSAEGVQGPPRIVGRPNPNDVLFGRKRNNAGNKRVRELVGDLADAYDLADKTRKTQLADAVVQEIKRQGGRFLKQMEGDKWKEVPNDFARSKISKHFRNNRRSPLNKESSD